MTQRLTEDEVQIVLRNACLALQKGGWKPESARMLLEVGLDLADARAEIARLQTLSQSQGAELERLKALSESQAQALDLMESGRL